MHGNAANRASLPKTLPLRACVTPGAKQLTRDIYDCIIQMCENERCTYDKTAVISLYENLTGFDPCIVGFQGVLRMPQKST